MKRLIMIIVAILILLGISINIIAPAAEATPKPRTTPTLYLHGYGGGPKSMAFLMNQAVEHARAQSALVAIVSPTGQVQLRGDWRAHNRHPLIQVIFTDNHTRDAKQLSRWLRNVLVALQARYQFKQFNVVAHSLGNSAVLQYLLQNSNNSKLPQLARYVAIAGNFDGIPGQHRHQHPNRIFPSGRPTWETPAYQDAVTHRDQLRLQHTRILNLYGNLADGSDSDGKILNASSRSLGYLVRDRVGSYHEHVFYGIHAQHSQLRRNPQVAEITDTFLWQTQN